MWLAGVLVAVAMTNQIAIVVRLSMDDGSVTAHVYKHRNGTLDPFKVGLHGHAYTLYMYTLHSMNFKVGPHGHGHGHAQGSSAFFFEISCLS